MWYSLDNGITSFTFTVNGTIDQSYWSDSEEGINTLTFYINDTIGTIFYNSVSIIKDTT